MTQSIVNFVTSLTPISGSTQLPVQENVFNASVSTGAQAYYTNQMTTIQTGLAAIQAGTATTQQIYQTILSLQAMNAWAQTSYVNSSGQEVSGSTFTDPNYVDPVTGVTGITLSNSATSTPPPTTSADVNTDGSSPTMTSSMATALTQVDGLFTSVISTVNSGLTNGETPLTDFVYSSTSPTNSPTDPQVMSAKTVLQYLAGIQPVGYAQTYNFGGVSNFNSIIQGAISSSTNASVIGNAFSGSDNLQQVLMVGYVDAGNTLLFNQMSQLNSALNINQNILGYLNSLQDLMNQKSPQQFIEDLGSLSAGTLNSGSNTIANNNYNNYESNTFNTTLTSTLNFANTAAGLSSLANPSGANAPLLQAAFNTSTDPSQPGSFSYASSTIIGDLTSLITQLNAAAGVPGGVSPTTQLGLSIQSVINDFNSTNAGGAPSIATWVADNQTGNQGQYQTDLNNAVTAAQSFNDTQGQQLNNVMFVFQEFYQSATSLLSNLSQLIQKMGSMISK